MDKASLLTPHLAEVDVTLPSGGVVRVRALSRAEVFRMDGLEKQPGTLDARMLALAMVDPPLTEAEVEQWREAAPNAEIDTVSDAILELSGLREGAPKPTHALFPEGSDEAS